MMYIYIYVYIYIYIYIGYVGFGFTNFCHFVFWRARIACVCNYPLVLICFDYIGETRRNHGMFIKSSGQRGISHNHNAKQNAMPGIIHHAISYLYMYILRCIIHPSLPTEYIFVYVLFFFNICVYIWLVVYLPL